MCFKELIKHSNNFKFNFTPRNVIRIKITQIENNSKLYDQKPNINAWGLLFSTIFLFIYISTLNSFRLLKIISHLVLVLINCSLSLIEVFTIVSVICA
jgi:hypothetical protein